MKRFSPLGNFCEGDIFRRKSSVGEEGARPLLVIKHAVSMFSGKFIQKWQILRTSNQDWLINPTVIPTSSGI